MIVGNAVAQKIDTVLRLDMDFSISLAVPLLHFHDFNCLHDIFLSCLSNEYTQKQGNIFCFIQLHGSNHQML